MRRAAVICEFNPFHNGHKFLLWKIRAEYADEIICIMSGSFVQRGDIAITDKYARAGAALLNGADMVVELPTAYAMASANIFADSGIRLAKALGCESLCFGAENSIEELNTTFSLLSQQETQVKIAERMKAGSYYPKALSDSLGEPYRKIIVKPNNILALEYLRACEVHGVTPIAIARAGVQHDDEAIRGNIASGSKIRAMTVAGEDISVLTPMTIPSPANLSSIEPAILYRLKTMKAEDIARIADVSEGLEHRIADAAAHYNSLTEILEAIKTKRYTMARLRRILLSALLDINSKRQRTPVPYARVLGVKKDESHLLHCEGLPLIVDVRRGYDNLNNYAKEIFDIDIRATELMNIAQKSAPINEFSYGLIKI